MTWAFFFLVVTSCLATVDAVYFHYWRHPLHAHPSSRSEYWLHVVLAVAFLGTVFFLLYSRNTGWGAFCCAIQWAVFLVDMRREAFTRLEFGGLSRYERWLHRCSAMCLFISNAFALFSPPSDVLPAIRIGIEGIMLGAFGMVLWQLGLLQRNVASTSIESPKYSGLLEKLRK